MVEKKYNTFRKDTTANGLSCVERNPSGFFITLAISDVHLSWYQPRVSNWFQRTTKSEQFLETVSPRERLFQFKRHRIGSSRWSVTSSFLPIWPYERKQHWPLVTGPAMNSLTKNRTADVQYAINKCESLGSGKQLIRHGNPSAIAQVFSPHMAVLRRHLLPKMQFECCMILEGNLGGNFDTFAASGEYSAWVLLWKTRSRPIGVRDCFAARFNFFSTAFDPRAWTMVVFWKEDSGGQPQLII